MGAWFSLAAQNLPDGPLKQEAYFQLLGTVNWSEVEELDEIQPVLEAPAPRQFGDKAKLDLIVQKHEAARKLHKESGFYNQSSEDLTPEVTRGYLGIDVAAGVPNDNYMAISKDGYIVNVVNTWVTMLKEDGTILSNRSLGAFVRGALGRLDRFYDPKVLYDPQQDRFILVFLEGNASADSRIVVAFSKTANPEGEWNFYALNGTPFGGEFWSDYPIIAHNKEDLFITVNILRDSSSWQEGFSESVIWQVNKDRGYRGDSLQTALWSNIRFNNQPVWSICAAQPGEGATDKDMYFLSVRPADAENDTVFVHYLSNSLSSGKAELSMQVYQMPLKYGVPPPVEQPTQLDTPMLQTNDARVLSAYRYKSQLQWVQTTLIPGTLRSGVIHSIFDLGQDQSIVSSYVQDEVLEYAYPSITWVGSEWNPNAAAITFSHSSKTHFPGTSIVLSNRVGNGPVLYSKVLMTREGDSIINHPAVFGDERWGDYTQIQRRYGTKDEVWICGTFGNDRGLYGTWINALRFNLDLSVPTIRGIYKAFPVPASKNLFIEFDFEASGLPAEIMFDLYALDGKKIRSYSGKFYENAYQKAVLELGNIAPGVYILRNNAGMDAVKIVVE